MVNLILVRHTESEWNKKGLWTGLTDISLSQKGFEDAKKVSILLKNFSINVAYTSPLLRAKQTLDVIKQNLGLTNLPIIEDKALNERDYGIYTGKNKWEIEKSVGEEMFLKIRRSFDYEIPNGESLRDVCNRVVPYYQNEILPRLKSGKNILIVAHGNSLRALVKYLENISDEDIEKLEIATGEIYVYSINEQGDVASKEIKQ